MNKLIQDIIFSLRPKHWIKNLFVFMPLVFGQKLFEREVVCNVIFSFIFFSLAASSVYLINDVLDYDKDKLHRTKRLRPIAAGRLSRGAALYLGLCFAVCALGLTYSLLGIKTFILIAGYFLTNLLYSIVIKGIVILDVFLIAWFFFLRIAVGTVASGVDFSHWMIFLVVLLALFLGFNKRRQELLLSAKETAHEQRSVLSKYNLYFIDQMISVLTSSIVVVYMMYTVDQRTVSQFQTNHLMYSIPFVYYGVFRYLYLVHRRRQAEDPVVVVLSDRMMQLNLILWMTACVGVIYGHL